MRGRLSVWPRRQVRARALAVGLALLLAGGVAAVLSGATGVPAERPQLAGGGAWLASPRHGLLTLLDGASGSVVGSVRVPAAVGGRFTAVQAGSSAYLIGTATGVVSRVDGATYDVGRPVRFGTGTGRAPLQVYPGAAGTYVIDGGRRSAFVVDPTSLRAREVLALAAGPGPGQSVVDSDGRLWVVDRGGVAWFDGAGKHVRPDAGGPGARLLLVGGRPVVVDLAGARAAPLDVAVGEAGGPLAWSCLDVADGPQPQLLGSTALGRVVAAVPATGMLVVAGTGRDDCGRSVAVGNPGDDFGPLVEAAGFVLVPDRSTGRTAVVDVLQRRVAATLPVLAAGHRLELLSKDGLVFYNDLDGAQAGVLRFDGQQWTVGPAQLKYRPGHDGPLVGAKAPPPQPPAGQPPVAQPPAAQPPAGQPPAAQPPVAQPPAGPRPPGPGATPVRLTVRVVGAGSVAAPQPVPLNAPAGTGCAADSTCRWDYPAGTAVTLRIPAAPAPGVLLGAVTGCDRTSAAGRTTACQLTLGRDATVQATFVAAGAAPDPAPATLTVTRSGAGTLTATPTGGPVVSCQPTCVLPVPPGTAVRLDAVPATGSYLADWGAADCATAAGSCTVPVAAHRQVTVTFAPLVDLTVALAGTGGGTVTGPGLSCAGTRCTGSYRPGTMLTLAAAAGTGSAFAGWTGCTPPDATTCTLDLQRTTSISAAFARIDGSPPDPTLTGLGQTVGIGTGSRAAGADPPAQITVTAAASDPDSAVTGIEIWAQIDGTCFGNAGPGPGPGETPIHQGFALRASAAATTVAYDVNAAATAICPHASLTFALRARATSQGGTSAFTDELDITYAPSLTR